MTDEELQANYGGHSDEELVEFVARGVPDWEMELVQRLLRLRRHAHYKEIIEIPSGQPQMFEKCDVLATKDPTLLSRSQDSANEQSESNESKSGMLEKAGTLLLNGCLFVVLFVIGIFLLVALRSCVFG